MTDAQLAQLVAALERNAAATADLVRVAGQQSAQIGLLVQSVALLMGEELGVPAGDEEESPRVDLDGNPY